MNDAGWSVREPLLGIRARERPFPDVDLSIVTTMYRSAGHIEEFYRRIVAAATARTKSIEVILVNDGSPDDALAVALRLHDHDERVRVVDLARNFGHHKAMMTGLSFARGRRVFLIDCDLEEPPEILSTFADKMDAEGVDVVFGEQMAGRRGGLFERWSGVLFYKTFNALSTHPIPPNLITARLMTAEYVAALMLHDERECNIAGLWSITGFRQCALPVGKTHKGSTTYSLSKKVAGFSQAITAFSDKPLVYVFYFGASIFSFSVLAAVCLFLRRILFGALLSGWLSVMISIWMLGGMTIFAIGLVGIYLSKVYLETKRRPYTVVRQFHVR